MLLESRLIKERQSAHNRKPRRTAELCTWQLVEHDPGDFRPLLVAGDELDLSTGQDCFGLFASKREATLALRKIAEAHQLCLVVLGLERTSAPGRACIAYPLHQCKGACIGKEPVGLHSARLMSALAKLKLTAWPYPGAIGIVETDEVTGRRDIHVISGWRYLGTAHDEADIAGLLETSGQTAFDRDAYQVLVKHLKGKLKVVPLY